MHASKFFCFRFPFFTNPLNKVFMRSVGFETNKATLRATSFAQRKFSSNVMQPSAPIKPERIKMLTQDDYAIFFDGDRVFRCDRKQSFVIPCGDLYRSLDQIPTDKDYVYVGEHDNKKIFGVSYKPKKEEDRFVLTPARDVLVMTDVKTSQLICRAKHLLNWHQSSLYSGCCGVKTALSPTEIAKICANCNKIMYPTTSSFVIVLVERNGNFLLARSPHFAPGMYSTIAGFVDAGESYEDAARREVEEEVGIKVKSLTYFGSQSWPFPSSMAVAFKATYESGDIKIDSKEIEDAKWFNPKQLPSLPHPCSISRHIIDAHIKQSL